MPKTTMEKRRSIWQPKEVCIFKSNFILKRNRMMVFFYSGFENIVKWLVEQHAELDVKDNNGQKVYPLFISAQNGTKTTLQLEL